MNFQKWLTGALLALCTASILINLHAKDPSVKNVELQEALELVAKPDTYILDVRSAEEFSAGHIEGAHLIPIRDFKKRLSLLPANKEQNILVYCSRGGRSTRAAGIMQKQGYSNIYNFKGGMDAWESARQPIEK